MAHTVFICHSAKDKQVADAACSALEARRIPCWIAPRDVLGGTEWGGEIVEAIAVCQVLVLIFSGNANSSDDVRREVELALDERKIVVPFRIENIQPTGALRYALKNRHWLDAITPPLEDGLNRLCGDVEKIMGRQQAASPLWQPQAVPAAEPASSVKEADELRRRLEELQRQVRKAERVQASAAAMEQLKPKPLPTPAPHQTSITNHRLHSEEDANRNTNFVTAMILGAPVLLLFSLIVFAAILGINRTPGLILTAALILIYEICVAVAWRKGKKPKQ